MTKEESPVEKSLRKKSRKILKAAMASIDFTDKVKPLRDEEDGEIYYYVEKKSGLKRHHVLIVDDALIECAKLYRDAGVGNTSKFYKRISRMVHYALYEIESREMLEHEILKGTNSNGNN